MSSADFFAASKVLVVAGKGGVGKTTVGAGLGLAAAQDGFDVLLIELEGHSNLGAAFECVQLSYEDQVLVESGTTIVQNSEPITVTGRLRGRQVTPQGALAEYLDNHKVINRLANESLIDLVASAVPGIRDVVALGKIRQLEEENSADLLIIDAPAAGHALTFLTAAGGLQRVVSSGPIRSQADQVAELLSDRHRCQTILVTLPEQTPVSELVETAFAIEDELDIHLGPVVANAVLGGANSLYLDELSQTLELPELAPAARRAAEYHLAKATAQRAALNRLTDELSLPQLVVPDLATPRIELSDVAALAAELRSQLSGGPA